MTFTPRAISSPRRTAGFTIVEVVITFIIIGILALILTPVLVKRSEQAKITRAEKDEQIIADALERVAVDTSYFVRIYALDDAPGGNGVANTEVPDAFEGIRDLDNAPTTPFDWYENPTHIFINLGTEDFATNQDDIYDRLTTGSNAETNFNFHGPYMNWYDDANGNDWPNDPWGADYIFFTVKGALRAPLRIKTATSADPDLYADQTDAFNTELVYERSPNNKQTYNCLIFGRPTMLSLGPDGLPGDGTKDANQTTFGDGDDIIRPFGGGTGLNLDRNQ